MTNAQISRSAMKIVHNLCIGCAYTAQACAWGVKNENIAGIACGIYFQKSVKISGLSGFLFMHFQTSGS
jgi:Fe-S-cluster-containing dehydrogenase component